MTRPNPCGDRRYRAPWFSLGGALGLAICVSGCFGPDLEPPGRNGTMASNTPTATSGGANAGAAAEHADDGKAGALGPAAGAPSSVTPMSGAASSVAGATGQSPGAGTAGAGVQPPTTTPSGSAAGAGGSGAAAGSGAPPTSDAGDADAGVETTP